MRYLKPILSVLVLMCFAFTSTASFAAASAVEAPSVSASANKKSYAPGESGVLTVKFKVGKNVKIPKDPEVEVSIEGADGKGLQDYTAGGDDYISGSVVKYNFTVPAGATSGSTITVKGKVKFGYCNSDDGVCKLATKNFTAKIKVK